MNPGYKQTEVGVIPEEWDVQRLGSVGHWFSGGTPSMANDLYWNGDIPWVSAKDMKVSRLLDSLLHVTEKAIGNGTRIAPTGAVLIVVRGMILAHTFPVAIATRPVAFNQDMKALVTRAGIDSEFILVWLQANAQSILGIASESTHGTKRLASDDLFSTKVGVPPLPEQRAIATALSDVDGLLGGLDRLIAKKRDLKQAAMQQLLTGQTRLPGFHAEWEVKAIQELSQVGRGRVISHTEISKSASPTYPVFSSQTSDSGIMGYLDTYDFEGDYVTWTTDGANAGTVFARSGRFNCTNVCGTIKLHDSDHRFISAALGRVSQSYVSRHLGNPKLMNDVVKKIQITIPKTRDEQTAIAEVLTEMDGELAALTQRREKTRALKQAMMQELLTGRTRLMASSGATE